LVLFLAIHLILLLYYVFGGPQSSQT
jgi:hypothetical protein